MALSPMPGATLIGSTTPRLYSDSLVELTPDTSLGFEAIRFANAVLGIELLPWQEWLLIHMLELRQGGNLRFKTVVTLLPRQSGKTELLSILGLYFLYSDRAHLILGTAQALNIAREAWAKAVNYASNSPHTSPEVAEIRRTNGEQMIRLKSGARYMISATTRGAGRGLSVDLLILDELREHQNWESWNALAATTTARPSSLKVCLSNAGDSQSVVLNTLRSAALTNDDPSVGLFEWSAPDGCALDDPDAWVASNPSLGYLITEDTLRSNLSTSTPAGFRTEHLCQTVESLDSAIDLQAWQDSSDPGTTLEKYRDELVLGIDVAIDGTHVSLIAAAPAENNRFRLEVIDAWRTPDEARTELPDLLAKLKPRLVAWLPSGPAGVLAPELRGFDAVEVRGTEVSEACQGFADLVSSHRVLHPGDPLLSTQVSQASRYNVGDGWRFARKGGIGYVDAVYASAIAVYVSRTHPVEKPLPRPIIV